MWLRDVEDDDAMTVADVCSNLWTPEEKNAEGENANVYDAVERRPATSRMIERFMMLYGMSNEAGDGMA